MRQYRAFLSYSHQSDSKLAPRLQDALQRFAKPWYRLRTMRIFRDQTGLAANAALWPEIERALEQSEYLVLLASPAAAARPWIKRELEWWITHRPVSRLLIVVTDGELKWDQNGKDFDWELTNALPPELRGRFEHEPLYVDLRWAKAEGEDVLSLRHSRFRSAVLDVAAALLNTSKDLLDGSDVRQYRRNRIAAGTAVMVCLTLGLIAGWQYLVAREQLAEITAALTAADLRSATSKANSSPPEALAFLSRAIRMSPQEVGPRALALDLLLKGVWPAAVFVHRASVRSAEFSADSQHVLSASEDGAIRLWSVASGEVIAGPLRQQDSPKARFSPDGRRVLTFSSERVARLWDLTSGQLIRELPHEGAVIDAAFSFDGLVIVTASTDKTARLWSGVTGQPTGRTLRHRDRVVNASFSPDSQLVVTASVDGTARVWDVAINNPAANRLPWRTLVYHSGAVLSVSIAPDGRRFVTSSADGTAQVWNVASGERIGPPLRHEASIGIASFGGDGSRVLTASDDNTARVWDAFSGQPIGPPLRHRGAVRIARFSGDGYRVLTASTDRTVQVWEASTGEPIGRPLYHHGAVLDAHFSLDGRHIVTASDVTAQVWSAPVRLPISSRIGSNDAVEVASFIGDERVASIGRDGTVRLWDASSTGQPLNEAVRLQQWHGVWGVVRLSPDGRRVAAIWRQESWHQGTAQIWDTISGRELFHWEGADDIGFSNDGRRLVMVLEKTARIVDSTTGRPIGELLRHTDDIRWAAFSADGETIVTGADAIARLWDTSTGKPVGKPFEHDGEVHLASLSPDGRSMVTISISNRGEARLWNRMTGQAVGMPLSDEASVRTASFSSDGGRIITTSDDGTVRLWNATTAEPIGEGFKHEASVIVAGFSPDGNRVVTGCRDGTVRVWDPQMGLTLGAPISHEGLRRLQMSPSGRRLLTLSSDGTVRTWDLPIGTADKADAELLAQSATMLSGLRVTDGGALVRATDQGEGLRKLRQRVLRAMPMQSSAESLIRWLFEHPWERTISPFSKTTAEVHIRNLVADPRQTRDEAAWTFPGHPLLIRPAHNVAQ